MKKNELLVDKVIGLLLQAKMPTYLHKFGPKKYKLWQHVLALFVKQECKLSFRRVVNLLNGLQQKVPTYSALCKSNKRIPLKVWQHLLQVSANIKKMLIGAMDAVFFSRTNPSYHYLKRIDRELPVSKPVQATALIDTKTKKCVALRVRAKRVHDACDRFYLLKHSPLQPNILVADKAYDCNDLHAYAKHHGFKTNIPIKKNTHKGFYRNYMKRFFDERIYHKRSLIETNFSCVKRKTGSHAACHSARTQRAEIFTKFITNNLKLIKTIDFQLSRFNA
ncbi:MAG: transposase [archaeon]|nr:transposase [archaeon]